MKGNKNKEGHCCRCEQISLFDEPAVVQTEEKPPSPASQNHILCRKNVFCCEKVRTEFSSSKYKFDNTCEITGQQWESGIWSPDRDYEKNPTPPTPCESCEHAKCEWCGFNSKSKEPYGCCGSCAYRKTCVESEWLKVQDRGQ
jgi:hypothetical protein